MSSMTAPGLRTLEERTGAPTCASFRIAPRLPFSRAIEEQGKLHRRAEKATRRRAPTPAKSALVGPGTLPYTAQAAAPRQ